MLATQGGLVKKTPLKDYDSPRSGGVIAINLREDEDGLPDELIVGAAGRLRRGLILLSPEGAVDPVHRDRRRAAPDGPCHLGRQGHEVPRRTTSCSR